MSNSVVPAAAAAKAKQLVRNKKLIQRKGKQEAAQDEQAVADHKSEDAQAVHAKEGGNLHSSMSDSVSGDFSFASALSEAAAGSASLTSEAAQDEGGYGSSDDGAGIDGTLLAVGALALAGAGAAIALGGGGKKNEAPTVANATQALTVLEDAAATNVTVTATDPDSDPLTYAVTTNPTKGTVTGGANGAFQYKPNADANGTDSFVVTVKDPDGLSVTQTVNVTITPVNDAPRPGATNETAVTVVEDTPKQFVVNYSDPEGNTPLVPTVVTQPTKGTFNQETSTYTPNANATGTDTMVIKVTDSLGASTESTITFTITPVNDAPVAGADLTVSTVEDTALTVVATATDVEGDALTFSIPDANKPAHGTAVVGTNGSIVYTPNADYVGTDTFTVKVDDGKGGTDTQVVNITVTPAGPVLTPFSIDVVGPNATTPFTKDASTGLFNFTDDATKNTDVRITGFTDDDTIVVTNGTADQYSFTTGSGVNGADDLYITFSNTAAGATNVILIEDVLANPGFVTDLASATAAVGYDFMTFA